jgi:hypothetical protein
MYWCREYKTSLPSGASVHSSTGGITIGFDIPKGAYYHRCWAPCLARAEYCQVHTDNGIYPVWRAADGRVYLTWDDIGDDHLVNIRKYLEMMYLNENTGLVPLPYLTVRHELHKRGLDKR